MTCRGLDVWTLTSLPRGTSTSEGSRSQGDCPAGDSVRENAGQRQMGAVSLSNSRRGSNHESADTQEDLH